MSRGLLAAPGAVADLGAGPPGQFAVNAALEAEKPDFLNTLVRRPTRPAGSKKRLAASRKASGRAVVRVYLRSGCTWRWLTISSGTTPRPAAGSIGYGLTGHPQGIGVLVTRNSMPGGANWRFASCKPGGGLDPLRLGLPSRPIRPLSRWAIGRHIRG